MWAAFGLVLACSIAPAPPADAPPGPVAAPGTQTWRRTASTAAGVSPTGTGRAQERCTSDCTVEQWERPGEGGSLLLVREGDRLWRDGRRDAWRTAWKTLSGTLALCLGPPLATPPAGDPSGYRLLHERGQDWRWSLHLTGANPCGLSGQVELDALADRVLTHDLLVQGTPWSSGGRELAAPTARALARELAADRWPSADEAERQEILAALHKDPDAVELLEQLQRSR